MKNSGVSIFDNTRKNFKSNLVLVVAVVLESKGLLMSNSNRPIEFVTAIVRRLSRLACAKSHMFVTFIT